MKQTYWTYLILFLVFFALFLAVWFQNLGGKGESTILWMKASIMVLVLVVNLLGILQGIFLILFFRSFFTTMQRSELSKFDLDRPL